LIRASAIGDRDTDFCWPLKDRILVQIGRPAGRTIDAISDAPWLLGLRAPYAGSSWSLSGKHDESVGRLKDRRGDGRIIMSNEAKQQIEAQTAGRSFLSVGC